MDKIILNNEDINFLLDWRDKNTDLVRTSACPLKKVKIIANDIILTCIRLEYKLKMTITRKGESIGKLEFEILPFGFYKRTKNTTKLDEEDIQSAVTVYASTMALLTYGGEKETKKRKTSSKPRVIREQTKRKSNVYILKRSNGEGYIVNQGSHKSPSYSFSVRGHFRHYKSGKVIWIEEYSKGTGNKQSKTYKL